MVLVTLSRLEAKYWTDLNEEAFTRRFLEERKPCVEVVADEDIPDVAEQWGK